MEVEAQTMDLCILNEGTCIYAILRHEGNFSTENKSKYAVLMDQERNFETHM